MAYYTYLFSPETFVAYSSTDMRVSGVRESQKSMAERLRVGDVLLCYMTGFSRWVGALRVAGETYVDRNPVLYEGDPFIQRIPLDPLIWLDRDMTIPIQTESCWGVLSFTRDLQQGSTQWTGKVRRSLNRIDDDDGDALMRIFESQLQNPTQYPITDKDFNRSIKQTVRRASGAVLVSIPEDSDDPDEPLLQESECGVVDSESELSGHSAHEIQGMLAKVGEITGHRIWLPMNDRQRVFAHWAPDAETMLDLLPLSYDEATIKTVQQIDVLWIKGRSIRRAFEVEHTTAIYSGLLRMADLLALQGNMQIALHIVAPVERRSAVLSQISRPVL